jgi:hypothetical protein
MRRNDDAIGCLEKAAAAIETDFWALGHGDSSATRRWAMSTGTKSAARRCLDRVEKLIVAEPDHGLALGFGVSALVALHEVDRAKEWTERALLLDPDNINLRFNLACNMVSLREMDKAIELSRRSSHARSGRICTGSPPTRRSIPIRDDPRYKAMLAQAEARLAANPGGDVRVRINRARRRRGVGLRRQTPAAASQTMRARPRGAGTQIVHAKPLSHQPWHPGVRRPRERRLSRPDATAGASSAPRRSPFSSTARNISAPCARRLRKPAARSSSSDGTSTAGCGSSRRSERWASGAARRIPQCDRRGEARIARLRALVGFRNALCDGARVAADLQARLAHASELSFHLDDQHPVGASHHQKIVIVDDAIAFVSGYDLTKVRWDSCGHKQNDTRRVSHDGKPYAPFHDVGIAVGGDCARALGELARERWRRATGRRLEPPAPVPRPTYGQPAPSPR